MIRQCLLLISKQMRVYFKWTKFVFKCEMHLNVFKCESKCTRAELVSLEQVQMYYFESKWNFHWLPKQKYCVFHELQKEMATHSNTLAWKTSWMEEPGRLQSVGLLRVGHNWVTSLSLFIFMHWRRKWQPTPVFLPGESQGQRSLVGCRLRGCTELDMTEVILQQQQQEEYWTKF